MNLHEYQGKELLAPKLGGFLLKGQVARNAAEARAAAQRIGGKAWLVKAQIHAGGRSKAGGIQKADSLDAVAQKTEALLGTTLITPQTGPQGAGVRCVYVEEACDVAQELYLSFLIDRTMGRVAMVGSTEGGVNIEAVAPRKVARVLFDPATGFFEHGPRAMAYTFGWPQVPVFVTLARTLYEIFLANDLSLLEINPLALNTAGDFCILDAKVAVDDNALFRQPRLAALRDIEAEDPLEREADRLGLSYVAMAGTVACMVNGAGLAMATMDTLSQKAVHLANFLDVGGGASEAQVEAAFRLLLKNAHARVIFVNIFGSGMLRCDHLARGFVAAMHEAHRVLPVVVRLDGANLMEGIGVMENAGLPFFPLNDLGEALAQVVALAGEEGS